MPRNHTNPPTTWPITVKRTNITARLYTEVDKKMSTTDCFWKTRSCQLKVEQRVGYFCGELKVALLKFGAKSRKLVAKELV